MPRIYARKKKMEWVAYNVYVISVRLYQCADAVAECEIQTTHFILEHFKILNMLTIYFIFILCFHLA